MEYRPQHSTTPSLHYSLSIRRASECRWALVEFQSITQPLRPAESKSPASNFAFGAGLESVKFEF